jgi:hypothetical protein
MNNGIAALMLAGSLIAGPVAVADVAGALPGYGLEHHTGSHNGQSDKTKPKPAKPKPKPKNTL